MERIYPRSVTPARPGARIHPPGLWAYRPAPKVHGLVFEFARRWDTPLLFFLGKSPIDQCDILRVVPIKVLLSDLQLREIPVRLHPIDCCGKDRISPLSPIEVS
jgi:hypothetical protein